MPIDSRRGFLRKTLGACWTSAALLEQAVFRAASARAQSRDALPALFDIEKLTDGVYAAVARPAALINCNAAIFETSDSLLIVDTHSKASAVASLVSQIRRDVTSKPVRFIVNSHFHWDHSQGNPSYKRIAPHADIVASEATRRLISELGAQRFTASVEQARQSVQSYKERLAAAKSDAEKAHWQMMVRDTNDYISEMRNYKPELPNVTFERDLILHDKAQDLHLAFRGRGHTGGDIVVFSPQKKVVATGDLLHGFAPYLADSYPRDWPRTLHHVAEFGFDQVIGGHAGVQHTRDRLYQMAGYIEELTEIVSKAKRDAVPVERIQKETTPQSLKSLNRGDYGRFISESSVKYRPQPPGVSAESLLPGMVADNIAHIYAALDRT
jgi:glyoxylase-like metal-dependent hydrolase (beta-lactamase superfamily II)